MVRAKIKITTFFFAFIIAVLGNCNKANAVTVTLRVAFGTGLMPYQFLDEKNRPAGMHIEIMEKIADDNGFVLEYFPMEKESDCVKALKEGKVDIVLGALSSSKDYPLLTNEISASSLCMMMPNDILKKSDMQYRKYTAVFQFDTANYYNTSSIGAGKYLVVGNQRSVLLKQQSGDAQILIGVKNSLLYQLYKEKIHTEYTIVYNYLGTISYAIALQEGDMELLRTLNNAIAKVRISREYASIADKWTVREEQNNIQRLIKRISYGAAGASVLAFVYVAANTRIKALLKKEVQEKTKELSSANKELEKRIGQLETESRLRHLIIESTSCGMVLFDKNYNVSMINSIGLLFSGRIGNPTGENIFCLGVLGRIISSFGDDVFAEETPLKNKIINIPVEGQNLSIRCNIHRVTEQGEIKGALLSMEDVTREEREKLEVFEKEKNRALNRMITGIAHEIKNPLMSIYTFSKMVRQKHGDESFWTKFSEFVPREAERINALVESLINYSKPVSGEKEVIEVRDVISDCLYLVDTAQKADKIKVTTNLERNLYIEANKNQIRQVLINIILNGIESMEAKLKGEAAGEIEIGAAAKEDKVLITVLDCGQGIKPSDLKRCMDPFFTTKASGTGMGLAISKQYIEENGGELTLESKEGEYTLVKIAFRRIEK